MHNFPVTEYDACSFFYSRIHIDESLVPRRPSGVPTYEYDESRRKDTRQQSEQLLPINRFTESYSYSPYISPNKLRLNWPERINDVASDRVSKQPTKSSSSMTSRTPPSYSSLRRLSKLPSLLSDSQSEKFCNLPLSLSAMPTTSPRTPYVETLATHPPILQGWYTPKPVLDEQSQFRSEDPNNIIPYPPKVHYCKVRLASYSYLTYGPRQDRLTSNAFYKIYAMLLHKYLFHSSILYRKTRCPCSGLGGRATLHKDLYASFLSKFASHIWAY